MREETQILFIEMKNVVCGYICNSVDHRCYDCFMEFINVASKMTDKRRDERGWTFHRKGSD
jgi:hypothetical protein